MTTKHETGAKSGSDRVREIPIREALPEIVADRTKAEKWLQDFNIELDRWRASWGSSQMPRNSVSGDFGRLTYEIEVEVEGILCSGQEDAICYNADHPEGFLPRPGWWKAATIDLVAGAADCDGIQFPRVAIMRAAPSEGSDASSRKGSGGRKNISTKTANAISALAAYMHAFGAEGQNSSSLAREATEYAAKIGLPGSDDLTTRGSSIRDMARAVIVGVRAAIRHQDDGGREPESGRNPPGIEQTNPEFPSSSVQPTGTQCAIGGHSLRRTPTCSRRMIHGSRFEPR